MRVNGSFQETVSIHDRGLAYGDGLFETIRLHQHQPVLLDKHIERLAVGAYRLQIELDKDILMREITALVPEFPQQGVLKIVVTRGTGGRGYMPTGSPVPTRILSLHALPDFSDRQPEQGIKVFVCRQRLAHQAALAGIKHLNRLEQVLASLEWPDDSYMEGLMLDTAGNVIEGTRSNLFWVEAGQLMTPALSRCGVAGIMRHYLMENIAGITEVDDCDLARLCVADEMFFCNSVVGIWPVTSMRTGDTTVHFSAGEDNRVYSVLSGELFDSLLASTIR